jgi:hypothetical protein
MLVLVTAKVAAAYSISIIAFAAMATGVTWGILQATRRIQWWHSPGEKLSLSNWVVSFHDPPTSRGRAGQFLRSLVRAFAAVAAGIGVLVAFRIRPGVVFIFSVAFLLLAKDLLSIRFFRYASARIASHVMNEHPDALERLQSLHEGNGSHQFGMWGVFLGDLVGVALGGLSLISF